ncbi:MAG TPA: ABC transporter permease [Candidatus Acidoferrales bacterium]|nr:ABC transporter permease [Candidatus Acidoferrales bacterium]
MSILRSCVDGLKSLFHRDGDHRELDREVDSFLELSAREKMKNGMSRAEAVRAARLEIGNAEAVKEEVRGWGWEVWIETLFHDVRYAARCFRRAPLFSATVILTIGLALGLNTMVFTVFNAYVLAPFSVQDPYSLYSVTWNTKATTGRGFSWTEFQDITKKTPVFSDAIAVRRVSVRANGGELEGQLVSGNYFAMLGVAPVLGRTLMPSDAESPGSNPVIVLSHAAWSARFGGDPAVVGRTISIRGHDFEIIGVTRSGFAGMSNAPTDFWAPITMYSQFVDGADPFKSETSHPLEVTVRVKPNFSIDQAQAAFLVSSKQLTATHPADDKVIGVGMQSSATVFPLTAESIATIAPSAIAFGLILLLACANVANMLLARAMARQREIGVRLALGAERKRLVRQLLTEGFLLAIPSALLGFVLAWVASKLGPKMLYGMMTSELAKKVRFEAITIDWRVFCFILLAAVVATVGFALVPALQATRGNLIAATRGEFMQKHRSGRLRGALVVTQVAICVMLLISAGIFLHGGQNVQAIDVRLDLHNVIEVITRQDARLKVSEMLKADRSVEMEAVALRVPFDAGIRWILVSPQNVRTGAWVQFNSVSPEFFDVFRLPLTRGRNFTETEAREEAPVVIVSEATAQKLWPDKDAVGQLLRIRPASDADRANGIYTPAYTSATVVGIARDAVSEGGDFSFDPSCIYFPGTGVGQNGYSLLIRVHGNAERMKQTLDEKLSEAIPGGVTRMDKMEDILQLQYLPWHVFSGITEILGAIALALTAIGIYGVIAYLVSERSRDIGIRMALGASSVSVVQSVLGQSLKLAAAGMIIGAPIALAIARLMASHVFLRNHALADAARGFSVYPASAAIVIVATICAAIIPARKASKLDPMSILRHN